MKRKFFGTLLSLLMIAGMVFQGINTAVHAEGTPHVVDTIITDFRIEKPKGTKPTELNKHEAFYLAMDWKVKDTHAILHKGDYFDIKLPDNLRFPPSYSQPDFDLLDANGEVIARAHVTHGTPNEAGGTIRVTFNEKIDNKYNVKGTLYLGALFNKKKIKDNQKNKFEVSVNGKIISTEIKVTKTGLPPDQILTKWGERVVEHGQPVDKVSWFVRINYRKSDLKNAVITDELSGNETYIKNSFELKEVEYNDDGEIVKELGKINLDGKLSFSNGDKSFRINLGSPGKKQYILVYTTTYTAGTQLKNKLKITYDGDSQEVSANFKDSTAGGTAGGDLASKIKLIKVDEEDNNIVLEDAIFEVTAPDGHKFELKTDADGTVISEKLTQGAYKVKEKKAPKGYELGTEEYTLNVTPSGGAIKKITNKRIKINICGKKTWDDNNDQDGKRPTQITVNLLKNGTKFKSVTVKADADGNWKYEFTNLDKYENGQEIKYTVEEEKVEGYETKVEGYNITNSYTPEKTAISVMKKWDDLNDQDGKRPEKIKAQLYANGVKSGPEVELSKDNGWTYTWNNLDKNKNGKPIKYTVDEVSVLPSGYIKAVDDSDPNKVVITNSRQVEKINICGKKTWDDNNDQDGKRPTQITVNLLKNGTKFKSVTVKADADGNWKYEFTNLDKYENGQEIKYTVEEEKVEGYTPKVEGYNITNSYTPEKTELKVTKTWDDENDKDKIRPASITVRLYANGKEKESIVLDKSNGWTYAWKSLDKYENGKEIRYTVTEDKVKGYESEIDSSNAKDIKIKNTHKPEKPKTPDKPNEKPKKPDTGDHSDIMMQMIMMMGSLLGIALITRKRIAS